MAGMTKDKRTGNWLVPFRYGGQKFLVSTKTSNKGEAQQFKSRIEETVHLLNRGHITIPPDADPKVFITSGGKLAAKPRIAPASTLDEVCDGYLADQHGKAETSLEGERVHIRHLKRTIGRMLRFNAITTEILQEYVGNRRKQKYRGKPIAGATIKKELVTFTQIWAWAKSRGFVRRDCPVYNENRRWTVEIPKTAAKETFQPWSEIESRIKRGKLSESEQTDLWDHLFLDNEQVKELLTFVKENAAFPFIHPMFVFAAYSGARRSEIRRSRVEDFDFSSNRVKLKEKKRDKSKSETFRFVDLHPFLADVMKEWFAQHPGGPFTIAMPLSMPRRKSRTEFMEMTPREAHHHFKEPLKKSKWKVLRGWHVLRHSFGANLARAGVPRDRIGDWMGHTTEEMKDLYQHLFPQDGASQIAALT